ncbi:MAG: ATPase, T2SS/T4P/T4SS family, partial [Candidatus Methanomethylophilaceae archaeon]
YLVDNRCTFLICGARGAGKSSLLSALMFEFPLSQRILTIEDTMELPGEKMRKMGYKVQSMLVSERMDGNSLSRAEEALRVSLRMGESAIVLGEVRGEEAKTLYQSMRTGRAGSSIMGTIHGDSAKTVYERVVHDMGIAPEAFMATDVLVTLGTFRDKATGNQTRKMTQIVATGKKIGSFTDISQPKNLRTSPVVSRILSSAGTDFGTMMEEVRLRGRLRTLLAEKGQENEKYLGPEWINIANEHIAKNQGISEDESVRRFEVKMQMDGGE